MSEFSGDFWKIYFSGSLGNLAHNPSNPQKWSEGLRTAIVTVTLQDFDEYPTDYLSQWMLHEITSDYFNIWVVVSYCNDILKSLQLMGIPYNNSHPSGNYFP